MSLYYKKLTVKRIEVYEKSTHNQSPFLKSQVSITHFWIFVVTNSMQPTSKGFYIIFLLGLIGGMINFLSNFISNWFTDWASPNRVLVAGKSTSVEKPQTVEPIPGKRGNRR